MDPDRDAKESRRREDKHESMRSGERVLVRNTARLVATAIAMVASGFMAYQTIIGRARLHPTELPFDVGAVKALTAADELPAKKVELEQLARDLRNELNRFKAALPAGTVEARLAVDDDLKRIRERLDKLDSVLASTPEKVISIGLMRSDIEQLKSLRAADIVTYKEGLDRIYLLMSFLTGGMFIATAGAVITMALTGAKKS